MVEAQPEQFSLDPGNESEGRERLPSVEVSEQEQHPPYGDAVPATGATGVSPSGDQERLRKEVQQRAKAWGEMVTKTYRSDQASGSADGEAELVPDYSSMPSRPLTPQGQASESNQALAGSVSGPESSPSLGVEGLLQQMLAMQSQMMGRLE